MEWNFHRQFIDNPDYYGTAVENAAQVIEELQVRKSWAICNDAIDWNARIEYAQDELMLILSGKETK